MTRASLLVITRQIDEMLIRSARLMAERDGADRFKLPAVLAPRASEPEISSIADGEWTLFVSRRTAKNGQKSQLHERVSQLDQEIKGLTGQHAAKHPSETCSLRYDRHVVPQSQTFARPAFPPRGIGWMSSDSNCARFGY
jgi:hypothetical protein